MPLTKDERLAFFAAFDKKLNNKNNGILTELKADAKDSLMASFKEMGADRKAIMANGEKVGEIGLSYTTAKPVILADKMVDALNYLLDIDLVDHTPAKGWEEHFKCIDGQVMCLDTGEFVDWAIWEPSRVKCATVRGCEPQKVLNALTPKLNYGSEEFFGLLMTGGQDDC